MQNTNRGISNWLAVVLVIIILIGAGVAYATYQRQQTKITNLSNQLSSIQKKYDSSCPSSTQKPSTTQTCPDYSYKSTNGTTAVIYSPLKDASPSNPVAIIGEIPGNWSSEAQFPVKLIDSKGTAIAQATANVLGNWQTTNLVPFSVQLTYTGSLSGTGTIVLQKDNPSGLSSKDDSISIPVNF